MTDAAAWRLGPNTRIRTTDREGHKEERTWRAPALALTKPAWQHGLMEADWWNRLTPEQILDRWQLRWGELSPEHRSSFLRHKQTAELASMRRDIVESVIERHKKLADALDEARQIRDRVESGAWIDDPTPGREQSEPRSTARVNRAPERSEPSGPSQPRPKPARKRKRPGRADLLGKLDQAAGMSGQTPRRSRSTSAPSNRFQSTSDQYAGAMRRSRKEGTPVERCDQCGAPVPSGSVHDCN